MRERYLPRIMSCGFAAPRHQDRARRVCRLVIFGLVVLMTMAIICRQGWRLMSFSLRAPASNPAGHAIRLSYRIHPQDSADSANPTAIFRIMQIADIHIGEAEYKAWGPEQDRKTWIVLDRLVEAEGADNIDLLILSGDQLTGNNVDANATTYYRKLAEKLSVYGIPFAMIFGNHDDAPFEYRGADGEIHRRPAKTSRRQLVHALGMFDLSLTRGGPSEIFGVSNYWLDVWLNDTALGTRIVLFDSGGGTLEQQVNQSQLDWFVETNYPTDLPVIAFSHIPTNEFIFGQTCQGDKNEGVATVSYDAGFTNTLQAAGNVHFVGVGHMHGNDYCCSLANQSMLHLCFGRHSGYGGYGHWERGARIYELSFAHGSHFSWMSYVRMESGGTRDIYVPAS